MTRPHEQGNVAGTASRPNTAVTIRPFDGEYEALVAIQRAIDPDEGQSLESWRHHDAHWPAEKYFRQRLVAELPGGQVAGWGQVEHMPWQFHPHKYGLALDVHPSHQRQGIGTALLERLLEPLRARGAQCIRTATKESRRESVDFLMHRGFREIQRYWESRLDVPRFDFDAFAGAEARAAREGITLTTLDEEMARHGSDGDALLRAVWEMEQAAFLDVPFPDPATPISFDDWRPHVVEAPHALHDAFFLARHGSRFVGMSNLSRNPDHPGVLFQGFTGVIRDYRGKGVAMALKLQTVKYARDHGYHEIRTGNNTRNRPMLRINEAMGFVKQPVWIEYERSL